MDQELINKITKIVVEKIKEREGKSIRGLTEKEIGRWEELHAFDLNESNRVMKQDKLSSKEVDRWNMISKYYNEGYYKTEEHTNDSLISLY